MFTIGKDGKSQTSCSAVDSAFKRKALGSIDVEETSEEEESERILDVR